VENSGNPLIMRVLSGLQKRGKRIVVPCTGRTDGVEIFQISLKMGVDSMEFLGIMSRGTGTSPWMKI
jgi:hypothetical protein